MMCIEVRLNMGNPNALCTVGMLSALLEKDKRDYIDLISPFVLATLPDTVGEEINATEIQTALKQNFGFEDMPLDFIKGILQRYTKHRLGQDPYVQRVKRVYRVAKVFDRAQFYNDQSQMRQKIDHVLSKMQNYFMEYFVHRQLSLSELRNMLTAFFESCGFTMAKDINDLKMITANKYGKQIFWVARFILDAYESQAIECEYLQEIVRGFLAYKALYYFESERKTSFSSKLKDVTFYLDCSLVINCLGYDSEEHKQEAIELVHLIRKSGGKVCVFEHTVAEAENLLSAFAKKAGRKNAFQLEGLSSKKYSPEILMAISSSVSENLLKQEGIETVPNPSYTLDNYAGIQDERAIIEWLKNSRKRTSKHNHAESGERFDYDTKSLASIGILRKNRHPSKIEYCKALLVTQDPWLNWCMKALCPNTFPPEIDFAMLDIDVVSLLWLSNYNSKSSLPMDILIANATAACRLSPDVMNRAIELVDELVENGDLTDEAALVIRSQSSIKPFLFDITQNEVNAVTPDSVQQTIDKFVKVNSVKYVDKAAAIVEAKKNKEIERRDRISQQELEKRNREHQQELEKRDKENQRLRRELKRLKDERDERNQQRNRATVEAGQKAARIAKGFEHLAISFFALVLVVTICIWGIKVTNDYSLFSHPAWNWMFGLLDLFSLAQIVDYVHNPNGCIKKLAYRLRDLIFTHFYNEEIAKID